MKKSVISYGEPIALKNANHTVSFWKLLFEKLFQKVLMNSFKSSSQKFMKHYRNGLKKKLGRMELLDNF